MGGGAMGPFNSLPPESVNFYSFWVPMDHELPPPVERKKIQSSDCAPGKCILYICMYKNIINSVI